MPPVRDGEVGAGEQRGLPQVGPSGEGPLQDWHLGRLTPRLSLPGRQGCASLPGTHSVPHFRAQPGLARFLRTRVSRSRTRAGLCAHP